MKKGVLSLFMLAATVMLKAQNPYPILPIDSVQFVNQVKLSNPTANTLPDYVDPTFKDTIYRDTVRFDGIVVTNPRIYGLSQNRKAAYIQRKGGGPWSGVLVMCEPAGIVPSITLANLNTETKFYDNFVVGFPVRITGVIRAFAGETQVNLIRDNAAFTNSVEQLSLTPDTLVYTEIQANQLMAGNPNTTWVQQKSTAEQWEGVLVEIRNVTVYSIQNSGNRTFWSVIDDFGNVLDVRDMSAYFRRDDNEDTVPKIANTFQPPAIGTRLEYIRGIVTEYAANGIQRYGIVPIYPNDVGPCNICPPIINDISQSPTIAASTDTVVIKASVDGDTSIKTVTLHYNSVGGNIFQIDTMELVGGTIYEGKIPPVSGNSVVKYFIRAIDNRLLRTTIPDSLATNSNYYVTDNGIRDIRTLQFSTSSGLASIWDGDSLLNISVPGIVTSAGSFGNLITVQAGTGPNSAIFIQRGPNDSATNWQVGDSVVITRATVRENFNITTLRSVLGNVVSTGNALPAFEMNLPIDSFGLNRVAYARPYEGVLVKWDSVRVSNTNPDAPSQNGEFSINKFDTSLISMRVDDLSSQLANFNRTLRVGLRMNYIQGVMYFSFGNFKLIPRGLSDIDLSAIDTAAPEITLKGNNPDTVEIGSGAYADSGAVAIDDKDGDISSAIVVTGTVNTTALGTYVLQYKVSDSWGNSDSVERIVVVKDTASVGLGDNELTYALVQVYPNPTSNAFTINAQFVKTQPVTITVTDLLGKEVASRTVAGTQFTETFDTTNLGEGVYFCTLRNQAGMRTVKVMVQH